MANVIAIVKLAPGEVGYYDELSRIHLTLGRPQANVYDYMNTSRLRRSVMSKTLILVAGTLNPTTLSIDHEEQEVAPVAKQTIRVAEVQEQEVVVEPMAIDAVEEIQEVEIEKEEVVVEATPKKASSKKKK